MRRLSDFLPALFCVLYLEHLVFFLNSTSEDPPGDLGYAGPLLGLLLAIALFSQWSGFWRRFSRFSRCLFLALATVGIAGLPTGILVGFGAGISNTFLSVFNFVILSAMTSVLWFPSALVISALYCLTLWVWEGRNDPSHFAGKWVLGFPQYWHRLLWILALGFIFLLGFIWHGQPASPSWVNSFSGDGGVLSLASGRAPDGTEVVLAGGYYHADQSGSDLRIVSLDAGDGHLRWVQQYPEPLPNMSKQPAVVSDLDGNVIVAWNYWSTPLILHTAISMLSGSDGHVVWEKQAVAGQTLTADLGAPVPDAMGRIWIPGIQEGSWNRVLALLDVRDGASHWEKLTEKIPHISTANDPKPGQIFPLKSGDAISFLSPYDDNGYGKTPWIVQCISGKDGATLWEQDFPSSISGYVSDVIPVVDEARRQVVILSGSIVQNHSSINLVSYDLFTGKVRWRSVHDTGADSPYLQAVSIDDAGDLVIWRSFGEQIFSDLLDYLLPLPLSPNGFSNRMRSVREVFSTSDGALLRSQSFGNSSERIQVVLSRPGSNQADALIVRSWNEKDQVLPWKAVFPHLYFWQKLLIRQPGGPAAGLQFPSKAVLTPSGRLVIAGPFGNEIRKWEIAAW